MKPKPNLSLSDACHENGSDQKEYVARIVDEHVEWLLSWHRLAFLSAVSPSQSLQQAKKMPVPKAFANWFKGPAQRLPTEQPKIDRLAVLHDQLHKLARMLLLKSEGKPLTATDYELVMARFIEFIGAVRNFESQFSASAAGHDTLTGLRSRFALCPDLIAEQKRLARSPAGTEPFCLALADIDQFKVLNQLHGQQTGDKALIQIAEIIHKTIRAYDDAYRVGADEFVICLKGTSKENAHQVLERLRAAVEEAKIRLFGGGQQDVTLSIGLVQSKADEDIPYLLYRAEQAVAAAKQAGGNCIQHGSNASVQLM